MPIGADPPYEAQPTSYDYDAPISEAGDITNKFLAVRKAISAFLPVPQVPIPQNSTKLALGKVQMIYVRYEILLANYILSYLHFLRLLSYSL